MAVGLPKYKNCRVCFAMYGTSRESALAKAEALALRVVADQLETGEKVSKLASVAFSLA